MKKTMSLLLSVTIGLIFTAGCGNKTSTSASDTSDSSSNHKIAMVVGLGGLGDQSFNDGLYNGVLKAAEENGIEYQVIEPAEYTEFNDDFMSLAADGQYDLIIGCGYDATEGIQMAAEEYPDQTFIFIDGVIENFDNVINYTFRDNEKTFLVGMMAALKTKTGKVGIVMATDTPDQNVFVAGYMAGVEYINPNIEVQVKYTGSYDDISKAKELALAMSEDNVDIIFAAAGGAGAGVYSAAADNGYLSIGVDTNLCPEYAESMFLSAYRNMEVVVANAIKDAISGNTKGTVYSVGLDEEAVGITNEGSDIETDSSFFEQTDEAKQAIIDGEISVPDALQ